MLLRRFKRKILAICHIYRSSLPSGHGITFDEFYSVALESLYYSMKKYKSEQKVSFYTYLMNTINKELIRYFMRNSLHNSPNISFDQISKEEGLSIEELIGSEDEKIKQIFLNDEIRECIDDGNLNSIDLKNSEMNERIYLLMMELTGQNSLSKKEITNLKRRIKYWANKKVEDND